MRHAVVLSLLLVGAPALADWEDGSVPEGSSAATVKRHEFRLNIIGRSAFGLSDRVELTSYLPLIIFPNLGLKVRFLEKEHLRLAFELDVGAGALPIVGGGVIPLPGGVFGAGGVGALLGSIQMAELHVSVPFDPRWTLTGRVGGIAMEGAFVGAAAGAGVGGGGAVVAVIPLAFGKATTAVTGGVELDVVLNQRNALVFQGDFTHLATVPGGLLLASASWIHAWEHVHLQVGLYNTFAVPWAEPPKLPVAPFVNVYWLFNRATPWSVN